MFDIFGGLFDLIGNILGGILGLLGKIFDIITFWD